MLMEIWLLLLTIGLAYSVVEFGLFLWISYVRKKFQWLIVSKYDENPKLSQEGLNKFIPEGYDSHIGWIRKPNTTREEQGKFGITTWSINDKGARTNPKFEEKFPNISCYGDSFTFCRQVNDDETWEHYLSELENTNVLNFGVGNYGIDQSFLRLVREFPKNKTDIVVLAVVPDTISRIMSSWKHYYEYGNTFAFKPRFILKNKELKLIENIINEEFKFQTYENYLDEIQARDYFYKKKFKQEILHFPYIFTMLKNLKRNISIMYWVTIIESWKKKDKDISKIKWNPMKIIMNINLQWRLKLYKNKEATIILEKIVEKYVDFAKTNNFIPVFAFLPQKDDITFIKNKYNFYQEIEKKLSLIEGLYVIPVTDQLLSENKIDEIYSDDNEYGGHFSRIGNQNIASIIHEYLTTINNK